MNLEGFDLFNETDEDISKMYSHLKEFLPFSKKEMGYDRPVTIRFVSDAENAQNMLGKTAFYNPTIDEVSVYVDSRHPKDIMRSISHELVHHTQNCRGEFNKETTTEGDKPYMQVDSHLFEMEREAFELGSVCFRTWEDNYKYSQRENKKMSINEETVRAAIRETLMKKIKEAVVRSPGDNSPLTPEEIKLFLAASGHVVEVVPPGVSGADVEEELPPGITADDVAEMSPEEEEDPLGEEQEPVVSDDEVVESTEEDVVEESTDREWYRSALNGSLIKRFVK